MDIFYLFIILNLAAKISSSPVLNNRLSEIDDNTDDLVSNQMRYLNDPNILKSDNTSKEFLIDEGSQQELENGKFFQGDIELVQGQLDMMIFSENEGESENRLGLLAKNFRWPKDNTGKVIVPYTLDKSYSLHDNVRIFLAMSDLEKYTCVRFKSLGRETDYISIENGKGCSSNLGKLGGKQKVTLQRNGCLSRGTIIHELIHALGYDHMHSHADRNVYVTIVWNNIDKSVYNNFATLDPKKFGNFGTPYDYYSVMHYSPTAFSKNGKRTIVPKEDKYRNVIGQRIGLSKGDAQRINNMYECKI